MDVLDTPLNLAHQQGRKADKYLANGKFEEAIHCHKRAADLLLESIGSTSMHEALQSLTLQRESHIRQEAIIRDKQWRTELAAKHSDKPIKNHGSDHKEERNKDANNLDIALDEESGADISTDHCVYQTMEETDSLLQFLMHRAEAAGRIVTPPEAAMLMARGNQHYQNGVKTPKDNDMIIEELRVHNEALRAHIQDLLHESEDQQRDIDHYKRELDHYRRENQDLKDRMRHVEKPAKILSDSMDSEKECNFYAFPPANLDDLNSIRLPPLEMPKFDFDLKGMGEDSL